MVLGNRNCFHCIKVWLLALVSWCQIVSTILLAFPSWSHRTAEIPGVEFTFKAGTGRYKGSDRTTSISIISSEEQKSSQKLPAHTHLYFTEQTVLKYKGDQEKWVVK